MIARAFRRCLAMAIALCCWPAVAAADGGSAAAHADRSGDTPRLLGSRALVRLGEWSYAFDLLHELVLRGFIDGLGLDDLAPAGRAVAALVLLGVAVAASGLLVTFVEKPGQARLRARPVARGARSVRQ